MLDDRSYLRDADVPRNYSATMILIWINVAVFILQEVNRTYIKSAAELYCMLSPAGIAHGYVWQLLTFQFMHADLWHIALNMLGLFFLGRAVEDLIGTRRFLQAYFLAGTVGGVFQVLLGFILGGPFSIPVVGASAGVFGITAVFGTLQPEATILFNFIPMRAKYLVWFSAIIAGFYVLVPSPTSYGVAHAAHFAGIGVGVAYVKWFLNNEWSFARFRFRFRSTRKPLPRELVTTPAGSFWKKPKPMPPEEDIPSGDFISKEVDPILDKIHAHGLQSLTEKERKILEAARAKMSRR
jgi:membrane associated rhomboid family serine protease